MKRIGIVGGMGAAAGARMYDMLIRECQRQGAVKDCDFPEVILHNIPSEGMDETGIAYPEIVRHELLRSVGMLNNCGAEVIMIACNSVHTYRIGLQSVSPARIPSMIDAAVDSMAGFRRVGLISSRSTKESGMYRYALAARDIEVIETTEKQQRLADELIQSAIAGLADHRLVDITGAMLLAGAEAVILGCTELPLLGIPHRCIDPSHELVKKVISL